MKRWGWRLGAVLVGYGSLVGCSGAGEATGDPELTGQGGASSSTATGSPSTASGYGSGGTGGASDGALAGAGSATSDAFIGGADELTAEPPEEPEPEPVFPESPSCEGQQPTACNDESCCTEKPVVTGELMQVAENTSVVVSSFVLDKFEVTVGRFRNFVEGYNEWREAGNPRSGDGAHPHTEGSGWSRDPAWESALPGSAAVLKVGLKCNDAQQTWTDEPGARENQPINCVSWYEAMAFCIWDGGRLPTEMEWQYAAVGGAQGREFAWGNTEVLENFAVYACLGAGTGSNCSADDLLPVGSRQDGNGRFGQSDLVGSVYEWVLDWYAAYPEVMPDDYAKVDSGQSRVLRGGAWNSTAVQPLRSRDRSTRSAPELRGPTSGFRCARELSDTPR